MKVARWGNSLAVRLPAEIVDALALQAGDEIEILFAGKSTFAIKKRAEARALLAPLRKLRGRLLADFKFDRLEANARHAPFE